MTTTQRKITALLRHFVLLMISICHILLLFFLFLFVFFKTVHVRTLPKFAGFYRKLREMVSLKVIFYKKKTYRLIYVKPRKKTLHWWEIRYSMLRLDMCLCSWAIEKIRERTESAPAPAWLILIDWSTDVEEKQGRTVSDEEHAEEIIFMWFTMRMMHNRHIFTSRRYLPE